MARILITGSSTGLGLYTATHLLKHKHSVVLHARNPARAADTRSACPDATAIVVGDMSSFASTRQLAADINALGPFDAVIHNAGLFHGGFRRTPDGLPALTATNTFGTYILSCLIDPVPRRTVFLSSGMHFSGDGTLYDLDWKIRGERGWRDSQAYSDSKLHDVMLANAFSRVWNRDRKGDEGVYANAMDPGWIPTRMGGQGATGSWEAAVKTYVFLATEAESTGGYWEPGGKQARSVDVARDEGRQGELLAVCERVTGVKVPER